MPSPPLIPEEMVIDTDHLSRMTLGEDELRREVLTMFDRQAMLSLAALHTSPALACETAHRLTGAARAIGAFAVGEAAEDVERAAQRRGDLKLPIAHLERAIAEARVAIVRLLRSH